MQHNWTIQFLRHEILILLHFKSNIFCSQQPEIYLAQKKLNKKIMNCQKTMTGDIPSPLLASERDRLKVLEGWERPPSCLDRGRGGASGPAKFKCHAQESEFPDIQLPRNRISRNNQVWESWVTMIATMKINLQNFGMKATQTEWQRCKYISPSQR